MNAKAALLCLLALASPAFGQGFAGLGSETEGFAFPTPETRFTFPDDHGAHPNFRIEWWYVTANLIDAQGRIYGIQWTLFRNAIRPGGKAEDQAWMGHAAIAAPEGHFVAERLARGGTGQAGVTGQPFAAHIDEWQMAGETLSNVRLTAQGTDFAYDLTLDADKRFVPQGAEGFSVKSEAGQASHYYSQPFYTVAGTLTLPSGRVEVRGQAWLDREWSSQPLTATQTGWDWVSLHFETGEKLMGYRLRDQDGSAYTVGTWITPTGIPEPLEPGDLTMTEAARSDVAGRTVPTSWDLSLPARDLTIRVKAIYPQSWMPTTIPYWEGPVQISGTHAGVGYLEMSGY